MKLDITAITYRQDVETAPRRILKLFLGFYIIYPMIFLGIITFSIGFHVILIIGKIVLLLCIPIIPAFTVAFLITQ